MTKLPRFIFHSGFPKSGSTSVQVSLCKSDVNYLGFYPMPKNENFYKTNDLSFFLEQVVRFGTTKSFDVNKNSIRDFLEEELRNSSKDVILSNENIVGRVTPFDLPNEIKIARAIYILPKDSIILFGIRELDGLLFSYYKLLLSNGYGEDIDYFFSEIAALEKAFGIIDNFRIKDIIDYIKNVRPDISTRVFDISSQNSTNNVFNDIGISLIKNIENKSFKLNNLNYHLNLNHSFYPGKRFLDWFEIHRVFPKSNFKDDSKYRLSRSRHLHNSVSNLDFLKEIDNSYRLFQEKLPKIVYEISTENMSYL
tara:strand:+ start:2630 stop:3556 length:927 start_codon:yes stop_codon:yes gene_type:complete